MKHLLMTLILSFGLALPLYGCADDVNARGDVDVDREEEDDDNMEGMAGNGGGEDDDETTCAAACDTDECVAACQED